MMKLDLKGMALTIGLVWGGAMLLVGVANAIGGGYGQAFLDVMASVYPGYHATGTFGDAIVGTSTALWTERSAVWFWPGSITAFRRERSDQESPPHEVCGLGGVEGAGIGGVALGFDAATSAPMCVYAAQKRPPVSVGLV